MHKTTETTNKYCFGNNTEPSEKKMKDMLQTAGKIAAYNSKETKDIVHARIEKAFNQKT